MAELSALLICGGTFFLLAGCVGLLRFPDVYCRMHATGKCDTLGLLLCLLGIAIHERSLLSVKVLLVAAFVFLANPTATHAIARAALRRGIRPKGSEGDDLAA